MSHETAERVPLAQHLEPELSPSQVDEGWAQVRSRLDRERASAGKPVRRGVWIGSAVALAAAALLVSFPAETTAPAGTPRLTFAPGARIEAPSAGASAELADGSTLALDRGTALRSVASSEHEVAIEVETGRALFDVARDPSREFRVEAGDVRVVVVGTRFSVQREGGRVSVDVERGRVEVHRGSDLVVLGPSERWEGSEQIPEDVAPPSEDVEAPARTRSASRAVSAPRPTEEDDARALFEAAREARRGGRSDRAAALFAELVDQHPRDARAPLAAFELGRLRLDVLHDAPGAVTALERSLSLAPSSSIRQDALARLVSAYDRAGRGRECREARDRYLREYAEGVHAQEVSALCD